MKKLFFAAVLFTASSVVAASETLYVERADVESGRVIVTGPVPTGQPRVVYVYPPACRPPYIPKFGGGCELPQYMYVPRPYFPGGGYSYFFYYRR